MKFLHTRVRVGDLDAPIRFYRNGLGLELLSVRPYAQGRFTLAYLAAPGDSAAQFELTYNWDEKEYAVGRNFGHIAYAVDNIYVACERLHQHGALIARPPRDGWMAFARSPDGVSIELFQVGAELAPAEPWRSKANEGTW